MARWRSLGTGLWVFIPAGMMAVLPWLSGEGQITKVLGMVVVGAMIAAALYARGRHPEGLPMVIIFTAFLFDAPWGRAFYDFTPLTETMGEFLFSSMAKSLGVPGMSVSIFEAAGMVIAVMLLTRGEAREDRPHAFSTAMSVSMVIPMAALFGIVTGVARGNSFGEALTQTRALATLPVWFFIGWCLGRDARVPMRILLVLMGVMLMKSAQGFYVWWRLWGKTLGEHEFLVEHLTSDYLLTAIVFGTAMALWHIRGVGLKLLTLGACAPMLLVFLLNNRRSAVVGMIFAMAFGVFAMPPGYFLRHTGKIVGGFLCGVLFIAATWNSTGVVGFAAHTIKSIVVAEKEDSRDYRIQENANLYSGLKENIFLGMGFGRRFPLVFKMANIGSIYANFDLIPHNTLIFLWAFIGPVGIAAFAVFIVLNIALTTRLVRSGRFGPREILAIVGLTMVVRWAVFVFSDIGLLEVRSLALMGLVLGALWRMAPKVSLTGEVQ